MVAKGGCGGLSDQFVTIPLFIALRGLAFYQKTVFPIAENNPIPANFLDEDTGCDFFFFIQPLPVYQNKPVFRSLRKNQNGDSDFGHAIP